MPEPGKGIGASGEYCGINGAFEPIARCYISLCLSRSGQWEIVADRDFFELEARRSGPVACMFRFAFLLHPDLPVRYKTVRFVTKLQIRKF